MIPATGNGAIDMEYLPRELPPRTGLTPAEAIHFAIPERIRAEALIFEDGGGTVLASADAVSPRCPACGQPSRRPHSRYYRTLADLPWGGVPVRFRLRVRKLFCDEPACPRKIFAEQLDGVARWYARRTDRQREALEDIGLSLGGRAGARLAARLGLRASRDTLLRSLCRLPLHIDYTPRTLGVDDWSLRKAQIYGTILVELERRRVVDLLPDRVEEARAASRISNGADRPRPDRADLHVDHRMCDRAPKHASQSRQLQELNAGPIAPPDVR